MAFSFGGNQQPINAAVQPGQAVYGQQPVLAGNQQPQYQPTGMPQGNVQQPGAGGLYPLEQGDAMYQDAAGQWQQPTGNAQFDANKSFIFNQVNAGNANPQQQGWYDKFQSRMGQNGSVVNNGTGQVTPNATTNPNAPQYGLSGAENALQQGLAGGTAAINQGVSQAGQTLSPYTLGGNAAFSQQANLTGANGAAAQQTAYDNYQESPGQAYLRSQGEKAIMRNAAATGGTGGGNVLQELQRHGIGLAAQDFQNSFDRLGSLSDKGYNASQSLSGVQANAGNNIGQMQYGTGANVGSARTRAGEQIANSMTTTSSNLANLLNQQGSDMNATVGTGTSNQANAIMQAGLQAGLSQEQMAQLIASINSGQSTSYSGQPAVGQFVQPDQTGQIVGNLLSGTGNMIQAGSNYYANQPPTGSSSPLAGSSYYSQPQYSYSDVAGQTGIA
jgi:hypothetical protein